MKVGKENNRIEIITMYDLFSIADIANSIHSKICKWKIYEIYIKL